MPKSKISIHALREEGDKSLSYGKYRASRFLSTPSVRRATRDREPERDRLEISIHALREEGDRRAELVHHVNHVFLSTPSVRRATGDYVLVITTINISIHALREEGDWHRPGCPCVSSYFYPRPP